MKKKIFICGNFGYKTHHFDGQTVKTRVMKDELEKRLGKEHIVFVDTSFIRTRPLQVFWNIFIQVLTSSHIIMMPDESALKTLLPFYVLANWHGKKDMRYIVIGGWLPNFLKSNSRYRKMVGNLDGVYVETTHMLNALQAQQLKNVKLQPNFRDFPLENPKESSDVTSSGLKVVFFSRVVKEKGIELAIDGVTQLTKEGTLDIQLDLYGPIQATYADEFEAIQKSLEGNIRYKGILDQDKIKDVLSTYDLMIFPTYFDKEGFPGAIIDAYIAGLPILASDWLYNSEFVKDGRTGKLVEAKNLEELKNGLLFFYENKTQLHQMRKNCLVEAQKYHVDTVLLEFLEDIKF